MTLTNSSSDSRLGPQSAAYLSSMMKLQNVRHTSSWRNNNSTVQQRAFVVELKDLDGTPAEIFRRIFQLNSESGESPVAVVPVAGWETEGDDGCCSCFTFLWPAVRQQRLLDEYAQSYSLSELTTAKNADVILRVSKAAQTMSVIEKGDEYFLRVSAGVRVTDVDRFLYKKGLALPPNMPTLHVASLVGAAANGSYGPARDYGPMSTNIVEMKMITPLGERITLSTHENPELFYALRDFHMGAAGFVTEITLRGIEPKFLMKRTDTLISDVEDFREQMELHNRVADEHFAIMYIPVDITSESDHSPRIRVTTFERTDERPARIPKPRKHGDLCDYFSLVTTELGEPLIDAIVRSEGLQKYFPFILKMGAARTYGSKEESEEIGWSADIAHIFSTYTDLPIYDINWLIQVDGPGEAKDLLADLLELVEERLKEFASDEQYPLFNGFARYLKGVHYPDGEGGLAPTETEFAHQGILSFELLTYSPLDETTAFKSLRREVVEYLKEHNFKFSYHPGKHFPETVRKLSQLFDKTVSRQGIKRLKKAIYEMHGGKDNLQFSPLLTPQKRAFLGLEAPGEPQPKTCPDACNAQQERAALRKIIELAEGEQNDVVLDEAKKQLDPN